VPRAHAASLNRRSVAVLLVLLLAGVAVEGARAADFDGTNANDVFFYQGTLQPVDTTLTNPYSGAQLVVNGTYNVNQASYDGLGGIDTLFMTNLAEFLELDAGGVQMLFNLEVFFAGDGDDILDLASTAFAPNTNPPDANGRARTVTVDGGGGNDVIWSNIGDDTLNGRQGNDIIDGGPGHDLINGGNGSSPGSGNDQLAGGDGDDRLNGEDGDDQLSGDAGDDRLDGGPGLNTLDGGPGTDTGVYLSHASADVTITRVGPDRFRIAGAAFEDTVQGVEVAEFSDVTIDLTSFASSAVLYGAAHTGSAGPSVLFSLDPATGVATPIGFIGFDSVSGLATHPATGVLYGVGHRPGAGVHVLLTIDPATGAGTEIGPTGVEALGFGNRMSDIAFRPADGVLFGYLASGHGLATIDVATGAATLVGATATGDCCGNGIGFSPDAVLFHATEQSLNTLDQSTGAASHVTDLAFPPPADDNPRISAIDVEPGSGVLFGAVNDGSGNATPEDYLGTIDPASGAVTLLGRTASGLDALAWAFSGTAVVRDAVLCYKVKPVGRFTAVDVHLADAFETSSATISRPGTLCAPASLNGAALADDEIHLTGYRLRRDVGHERREVRVGTTLGVAVVKTVKPEGLLVPAAKSLTPPAPAAPDPEAHEVDHFQCYTVRQQSGPKGAAGQQAADQFQDKTLDLRKVTRLCAPVDKEGEGIEHPGRFLLCYLAKTAKGQPKHARVSGIHTTDQFGSLELQTAKETDVCLPAVVDLES
jgi:hypothetical protein